MSSLRLFNFLLGVSILVGCQFAQASVCDTFRSSPGLSLQLRNCEKIVKRGLVPNSRALEYSINYMMANHHHLQYPECAERGKRIPSLAQAGDVCQNCQRNQWIEKGIDNNCSLVINDLKRPWTKTGEVKFNRSTGYFIDLCAGPGEEVVSSFYINGGTGKPYDDKPRESLDTAPSNSSTLAGAFLLNGEMHNDFNSGHPDKYAAISEMFMTPEQRALWEAQKKAYPWMNIPPPMAVPAIRMVGLNSSNNTTEFDKPFHVSVFGTGLGCVGVNISTYPIMKKVVAHGSSLYMAYAGPEFEQKPNKRCENEKVNSDITLPVPATASVRATASVDVAETRVLFDVPTAAGAIRKMQVDVVNENGYTYAKTKYVTATGENGRVYLVCYKNGTDSLNCRRGDNGGSFDLDFNPTPHLTIGFFSAALEDAAENNPLVLRAKDHKLLVLEGKKATLSPKDAF